MSETRLPINIKLPDTFLHKEERCGYIVNGKLKKIWAVELDLLETLLQVCKKYDLKVSLGFGSLLGAVRHKGFIPWDDDLDVWMPRESFERLLEVADKEFKKPYFLQTALSDREFFIPYARLRNSLTTGAIAYSSSTNYNNGIFVDIYVLDGFSNNRIARFWQYFMRVVFDWILCICANGTSRRNAFKDNMIRYLKLFKKPLLFLSSYETWYRRYVRNISRWTNDAEVLCPVVMGEAVRHFKTILTEEMNNIMEIDFEWLKVPVSKAYDDILKRFYGPDYMEFPPIEKRGKWHEGTIRFEPEVPYAEVLLMEVEE